MDNKTCWSTYLECVDKVGTNRSLNAHGYQAWLTGKDADTYAPSTPIVGRLWGSQLGCSCRLGMARFSGSDLRQCFRLPVGQADSTLWWRGHLHLTGECAARVCCTTWRFWKLCFGLSKGVVSAWENSCTPIADPVAAVECCDSPELDWG